MLPAACATLLLMMPLVVMPLQAQPLQATPLQAQQSGTPYAPLVPPPQKTQQPAPIVRPKSTTAPAPVQPSAAPSRSTPSGSTIPAQVPAPKPAPIHHYAPAVNAATNPATLIQASPGPFNRTSVFIDAAHGGADSGGRINDTLTEKDIDLQLAFKLRSLLSARGFNVILSRDGDAATVPDSPDTPLTLDLRAGMGNHARPVACLLLHATGSGRGIHLYSSELTPTSGEVNAAPWLTAQAPWVTQSLKLQKRIGQAITRAEIPLVLSRASVRPVDSLTCPALVVELAPENNDSGSIAGDAYQQRVAQAIASALIFWQNSVQPPPRLIAPAPTPQPSSTTDPSAPASPSTQPGGQP